MTREWLDNVAGSALAYRETLEATYDIAMSCLQRGIPGDFVECGVYAGAHCAVMAQAIMDYSFDVLHNHSPLMTPFCWAKRVHLFDSFRGLPPAAPVDQEIYEKHADRLSGEAVCSLEAVKSNMQRWSIPDELLMYHAGWFGETVPFAVQQYNLIRDIALLRLDADLYESTKDAMALYPLVSRGGWVIVDDWNLTGCRKAIQELVVPAPIYWRIPTK